MAASPVLLVADDLALIAAVKRVLAREGYEVILATNAADAVIGFGHDLPGLVLLQTSVESDRGAVVLEELQNHPDSGLLRVVLLGEGSPGSEWPIEPLPIDPAHFAATLERYFRTGSSSAQWTVIENARAPSAPPSQSDETPQQLQEQEPEGWRSTSPGAQPPRQPPAPIDQLEARLFGDLAADVEAEVMASVRTSLPNQTGDEELTELEAQVRAEAQRRRASRQTAAHPVAPGAPAPEAPTMSAGPSVDAFEGLDEAPTRAPSRAAEALARAEQQLFLSRAHAEATQRADDEHERRERLEREHLQARLMELERALEAADHQREVDQAALAELEERLAQQGQQAAELEARVSEASRAREEATHELEQLRSSETEAKAELEIVTQAHETQQRELEAAMAHLESLNQALTEARATAKREHETVATLEARLEASRADVESLGAMHDATLTERDTLKAKVAELEPQVARLATLEARLDEATRRAEASEHSQVETARALEAITSRAEQSEATAQLAAERIKSLEEREVLSLSLPGRQLLGVARHGTVTLEGLSRLVAQLVIANVEVRLELGVPGGSRTLWLRRGQVIAAESSFESESLQSRARRDGLIDGRQDEELRMLRAARPREQLDALKARGFIRDAESVALVQRFTEQVALDAFTEPETHYRLVEQPPEAEVLVATVPRPTLPMLTESLRRAVEPQTMLEQLGGGEAVVSPTDSELDLRALGFSERERKMLSWADGEATVQDLSLASGLKPDSAFRALVVAKLIGVIEVKPGEVASSEPSPELDVKRLEAKYDEVQDADYFTILGLTRTAGADDVRRAFERLSSEFDPLRFSGHPDPGLQQRAQVVNTLLEEAARALEDDRRRVEYARHLLD